MGTLTAKYVLDGAWITANDEAAERWKPEEGLRWLNTGQRAIATGLRSAWTVTAIKDLEPLKTRQSLAGIGVPEGTSVIGVHAFAKNGTLDRSVIVRDKRIFDERDPYWRSRVATAVVDAMLDPDEPTVFYVHPAVPAGQIELTWSALPPDVASINAPITLADKWESALQAYVLYRFWLKDATFSQGPTKAAMQWELFKQLVGVTRDADLAAFVATSTKGGAQ